MDKEIAEAVLKRANGYCEHCGMPGELTLHHRKLRSQGGKDEVSNLIAVLHNCHLNDIHANPKIAKVRGWIVPSWAMPSRYPLHTPEGEIVRLTNEGTKERLK